MSRADEDSFVNTSVKGYRENQLLPLPLLEIIYHRILIIRKGK